MRTSLRVGKPLALIVVIVAGTLALGFGIGVASDRDEAILTVQVTSADHEVQEGYFTLGTHATVMVRPGSDLYKFLSRQRGRKVKIVLTEARIPHLESLISNP